MAEEKAAVEGETKETVADVAGKKKSRGFFSRIWNGIFRVRGDDFEKRLQHISKEEATVLARLKRRALTWRRMARNLIIFSVIFEVILFVYCYEFSSLTFKSRLLNSQFVYDKFMNFQLYI